MDLQGIWTYAQTHRFVAIIVVFGLIMLGNFLVARLGFNVWYLLILAIAAIVAVLVGLPLYFWPFVLGMTTAFAEIINKFDDEPMKALKSPPALFYHVLNGMISVFALYLLALIAGKPASLDGLSALDKLKYVVVAGLGAMLIMRSKLFNIKVGDANVSFGPDQIITTLFRFMESAIGRFRARARRGFIEEALDNINFDSVYERTVMTLRRASRTISTEEMTKSLGDLLKIKETLDSIDATRRTDAEIQLKSYELGYVIYDRMGEDFVTDLFSAKRPEWLIRPPADEVKNTTGVLPVLKTVESNSIFVKAIPFLATRDVVPYMAYGTNMSSNRIRERLNWTDSAGKDSLEKTKPVACKLKGFRLTFNGMSASNLAEGHANIKPDTAAEVEGVLYQLPKTALDFLEYNEPGYHRLKLKVAVIEKKGEGKPDETKEVEAWAFVADSDQIGGELPPNQRDLASMIEGAVEHGLTQDYREELAKYQTTQLAAATSPNGGAT